MSETEKKFWPCPDVTLDNVGHWIFTNERGRSIDVKGWDRCPLCQSQRPEDRDELDEIFKKYGFYVGIGSLNELKKDLRAWKEKDRRTHDDSVFTQMETRAKISQEKDHEEEKQKLWEILKFKHHEIGMGNIFYFNILAETAVDALERVIDEYWRNWTDGGKSLKAKLRGVLL